MHFTRKVIAVDFTLYREKLESRKLNLFSQELQLTNKEGVLFTNK